MFKRLNRLRAENETGWAMLLVLVSMLVLSGFVAISLASGSSSERSGRRDQDYDGALQAAQAGVDDYVARLDANQNYAAFGNVDASNPALVDPASPTRDSVWVNVPGQQLSNNEQPKFHYSVIANTAGQITLRSTGLVRSTKRTVQVTLGRDSFLKYVYFSNFETIDPNTTNPPPTSPTCNTERYAGRSSSCPVILFKTGDDIKGNVHSEDSIEISGSPTFEGAFTTAWNDPAGKYWIDATPTSTPNFAQSPKYSPQTFPASNSLLEQKADPTYGGTGCLYTGPTRIYFNGANMTILSPFTTSSNPGCGTWPSATEQTIPVPSGQVIYVNPTPATATCTTENAAVGFPVAGDTEFALATSRQAWNCRNADLFVEGTLKGQLTLGSSNNIVVTGNLTYQNGTSGSDVLGLAAQNFVEVYHPITCLSYQNDSTGATTTVAPGSCKQSNGTTNYGTDVTAADPNHGTSYPHTDETIDAAIVASSESFIVEGYGQGGNRGTLNVLGGITQNYRGPVGLATSPIIGYSKSYVYDTRLLNQYQPPWLAALAATSYGVTQYSELSPD